MKRKVFVKVTTKAAFTVDYENHFNSIYANIGNGSIGLNAAIAYDEVIVQGTDIFIIVGVDYLPKN